MGSFSQADGCAFLLIAILRVWDFSKLSRKKRMSWRLPQPRAVQQKQQQRPLEST